MLNQSLFPLQQEGMLQHFAQIKPPKHKKVGILPMIDEFVVSSVVTISPPLQHMNEHASS